MAARGGSGAEHTTPTARRMIVGAQLRRLRERAGISRGDAGYHIRASESKISRLELGRVSFKERDVADLLTLYGVTDPDEREVLLSMVERPTRSAGGRSSTTTRPSGSSPTWAGGGRARIQTYELQFVPGLLQTADYARAVITHGCPTPRARRPRRWRCGCGGSDCCAPRAPKLWAVLDESVIHRPIGAGRCIGNGAPARDDQAPHITVQIVPDRSGYAAEGAFTLLRFAQPSCPTSATSITSRWAGLERPEIERIGRSLDRLAVDAETPERSRQMIAKMLAES